MAVEKQASDKENDRSASADTGGLASALINGAAKIWHALTDDGILAAAGRMGLDELGTALKAFPDSIQVEEHGALWNPLQSEVAADRNAADNRAPWPSEIAEANRQKQAGNDYGNGHENGHDAGMSM